MKWSLPVAPEPLRSACVPATYGIVSPKRPSVPTATLAPFTNSSTPLSTRPETGTAEFV